MPCPPLGDLPDPGIKPVSLRSSALAGGSSPLMPPGKPLVIVFNYLFLVVPGVHCCARAFSSCCMHWLLFVEVRGLLLAVASLAVENRLYLGAWTSVVAAHGL